MIYAFPSVSSSVVATLSVFTSCWQSHPQKLNSQHCPIHHSQLFGGLRDLLGRVSRIDQMEKESGLSSFLAARYKGSTRRRSIHFTSRLLRRCLVAVFPLLPAAATLSRCLYEPTRRMHGSNEKEKQYSYLAN